jgi:hypothetical protein
MLLLRWMLEAKGPGVLRIEAGWRAFMGGASGAVWAASGGCDNAGKSWHQFSELENVTAISNFWALTAHSLIGKSWKIVERSEAIAIEMIAYPSLQLFDFSPIRGGKLNLKLNLNQ